MAPTSAQAGVSSAPSLQTRSNNFNALRFLLAVCVVFTHSYILIPRSVEIVTRLTRQQENAGGIAVDAFFIISGYLIAQSWLNSKSSGDYFRKRILRIYPGYIVCALLCLFLIGPLAVGSGIRYFHTALWQKSLFSLPFLSPLDVHPFALAPVPSVNSSLWTIAIEFACYILIALMGWIGAYRDRRSVLGVFVAVFTFATLQRLLHWHTTFALPLLIGSDFDAWPRLFTFFLAGMTFYFYRDCIRYTTLGAVVSALVLVVSCFVRVLPQTLPVFGTYLLFYIALHPGIRLQNFGKKTDLSYGIYLYGWPVQQLLLKYLPGVFRPLTLFAAALPLACACAYLSWNLVEKPFLKRKPRPAKAPEQPKVRPSDSEVAAPSIG